MKGVVWHSVYFKGMLFSLIRKYVYLNIFLIVEAIKYTKEERNYLLGEHHACSAHFVHIKLLLIGEAKNVEGFVHDLHLFYVIDRIDSNLQL